MLEDTKPKLSVWVKADGKTEITLNDLPATAAKAKELGWKKKSK
jgi:hypothetical protein